jgi:hypothetical protein
MAVSIKPLDKVVASSMWNLESAAFDIVNFRSGGNPTNSTLNADTPKGVLGGSVARISDDWESTLADHTVEQGEVLGLYNLGSEGNAFENAPAAASGKVAINMHGGNFLVYVFETNSADAAYGDILASYTVGTLLYTSPFGLLTTELPSGLADHAGGVDTVIAQVTKAPTATDLELGIKLLI